MSESSVFDKINISKMFFLNCAPVILSLIVLHLHSSEGYLQNIILYEGLNQEGNSLAFTASVPDLSVYPLTNISSFCVQGLWALMEEEDYITTTPYSLHSPTLLCLNDPFPYKSFRRGGAAETYANAVSLFNDKFFRGEKIYVDEGLIYTNISLQISSGIWTGPLSWTIFDEPNFGGNSACLFGDEYGQIKSSENIQETSLLSRIASILPNCPIFLESQL